MNRFIKKLRKAFVIPCVMLFVFAGCDYQPEYEYKAKAVNTKAIIDENHVIAFTDGDEAKVTFGLYSLVEKGDTMVFKVSKGLTFNVWSASFVEVRKQKY